MGIGVAGGGVGGPWESLPHRPVVKTLCCHVGPLVPSLVKEPGSHMQCGLAKRFFKRWREEEDQAAFLPGVPISCVPPLLRDCENADRGLSFLMGKASSILHLLSCRTS